MHLFDYGKLAFFLFIDSMANMNLVKIKGHKMGFAVLEVLILKLGLQCCQGH